jgi:hypothetical protein
VRVKHGYGRRVLRKTGVGRRVAIIAGLTLAGMAALAAYEDPAVRPAGEQQRLIAHLRRERRNNFRCSSR